MNITLTCLLIVNAAILATLLVIIFKFVRFWQSVIEFKESVIDFITPPNENTPSDLAKFTMTLSDTVARSLVAQLKATFMGKQSGDVRAEKAIQGDLGEALIEQANPGLAALINSFPALRKTLRRNPQLIDLALSKLAPGNKSQATTTSGNGSHSVSVNLDP